ncbi:MAG TPA: CAP domain-containing protein [Gaiellaceae bacterium]
MAARWTRLTPAAAALLVGVLVATVPATAARPHVVHAKRVALSSLEIGVLDDLNAIRARHGLSRLTICAALTATAEQHTREMAADGYFAHPSADGTAFWKRIARTYPSTGYGYWSVGENLLWSSPDVDPAEALRLWMNSPEHRANILDPHWREVGVAAVHVASAPGAYDGREVTLVTTDFGVRR